MEVSVLPLSSDGKPVSVWHQEGCQPNSAFLEFTSFQQVIVTWARAARSTSSGILLSKEETRDVRWSLLDVAVVCRAAWIA
jgi:hypothetical protein